MPTEVLVEILGFISRPQDYKNLRLICRLFASLQETKPQKATRLITSCIRRYRRQTSYGQRLKNSALLFAFAVLRQDPECILSIRTCTQNDELPINILRVPNSSESLGWNSMNWARIMPISYARNMLFSYRSLITELVIYRPALGRQDHLSQFCYFLQATNIHNQLDFNWRSWVVTRPSTPGTFFTIYNIEWFDLKLSRGSFSIS